MKKLTILGEVEILDAHSHFFSRKFFETLISQSPQLSKESDALDRVGAITGWTMPPQDPKELAAIWTAELDRHNISTALMMASGRRLGEAEHARLAEQQLQAQRWTYIGSGMSHPNFLGTVQKLSPASAKRLAGIAPVFC